MKMENISNCTLTTINENGESICFESETETLNMVKTAIVALFLIFIFLASVIGNILVFLVFCKKPALLTISNRFILNLTICNSLNTIVIMPFMFVTMISEVWMFGYIWCKATGFIMNTIFAASTLTLVAISIDRYCAVATPLHYTMKITRKRALLMTISVWIVAVVLSVPPLFGWNEYVFQSDKASCTVLWATPSKWDKFYTLFLVSVSFALPLIVILWGYIIIFRAARNNSERTRRNSVIPSNLIEDLSQVPLKDDRRRYCGLSRSCNMPILHRRRSSSSRTLPLLWKRDEWKTALTSFLVVFTFVICWLPYFIIIILESVLNNPKNIPAEIETVSILLAMSSCAINPLVYVFRNKSARQELKFALKLQRRQEFNESRRGSTCTMLRDGIIRQGSTESDIILEKPLHLSATNTTLTSLISEKEQTQNRM